MWAAVPSNDYREGKWQAFCQSCWSKEVLASQQRVWAEKGVLQRRSWAELEERFHLVRHLMPMAAAVNLAHEVYYGRLRAGRPLSEARQARQEVIKKNTPRTLTAL